MNNEIENAERAARDKAQYDMQAKRLLSHKEILGNILIRTVDDFKGMNAADAANLIEGEVHVSTVPVEPGLTNAELGVSQKTGNRIVGLNTENGEVNEGTIRYDLIFNVRTPERYGRKSRLARVIVNVEMQKTDPTNYDILNRAVFYVSRMISSQKDREFVNDDYDGLQRVYNIWIVMGMDECILNHIHLTDDRLLGHHQWKGNLDLVNIIMIGMPDALPEQGEAGYELHRLLGALLSQDLSFDKKMEIIQNEYHIEEDVGMRKELTQMCNLGEGLVEREQRRIILNMHNDGDSNEKISRVTGRSLSDVQTIIKTAQRVMA